jgi:hypothetical protein
LKNNGNGFIKEIVNEVLYIKIICIISIKQIKSLYIIKYILIFFFLILF